LARDPVADYEKELDEAVLEGRKYMAEAADTIAMRPLGATPVASADRYFDWQNRQADYWPNMMKQALTEAHTRGQGLGFALKTLLEHDRDMQKRQGDGSG
jgi:hypothetical protein